MKPGILFLQYSTLSGISILHQRGLSSEYLLHVNMKKESASLYSLMRVSLSVISSGSFFFAKNLLASSAYERSKRFLCDLLDGKHPKPFGHFRRKWLCRWSGEKKRGTTHGSTSYVSTLFSQLFPYAQVDLLL